MNTAGSPPVVTLTGSGVGPYRPGQQVRAVATAVDPDTRRDLITGGRDEAGADVTTTLDHVDRARITSAVWKSSGAALAVSGMTVTGPAPRRSDTIVVTVVDAQGHEVSAELPVTVRAFSLGVDVDTSSTPAYWLSELNGVITGRRPTGPTKLFQASGLPVVGKYAVPAGMIPHYTFAQLPTEVAFRAWVATLAGPAWVTPLQEIDRKMALPDAAATYARIAAWMDSAPAGVQLVPNITASWQENPDPAKGQGKQWASWAQAFAAVPGITTLGVDMYVGGQGGYRPIDVQLDPAATAAHAAGLDLAVPEFAVVVPVYPTAANLDERAGWITATLGAFDARGVVAGAWWNAKPTSQVGTFRLAAGDPGYDALRAGLAT